MPYGAPFNPTQALGKGLEVAQRPLVNKGAIAGLQQGMDPGGSDPQGGTLDALKAIPDVARGMWNNPRETLGGFGAGALEGARQQTSPIGLANIAATGYGAAPMVGRGLAAGGKLAMGGLRAAMAPAERAGAGWGMRMADEAAEGAAGAAKPWNLSETLTSQDAKFGADQAAKAARMKELMGGPKAAAEGPISWGPKSNLPTGGAMRAPKAGGVLEEVLNRAATKSGTGVAGGVRAGMGGEMTSGEQQLLDHYSQFLGQGAKTAPTVPHYPLAPFAK